MAVVSIAEFWDRDFAIDQNFYRTYKRTFTVETNNVSDGGATVAAALPIRVGQIYDLGTGEKDTGSVCLNVAGKNNPEDPCQWTVVASYGPWQGIPKEENPLDQPPEISWSFTDREEIVDEDIDGNPVVNSAGDQFDPPIVRDNSRPVLSIVRNEKKYDQQLVQSMKDSINLDQFLDDFDPGTAKVADIQGRRAWHPTCGFYWIVTYEFHIQPEGWTKIVLNAGLREIVSNERVPILIKGQKATSPVPLDADGVALDFDQVDDRIYLPFKVYESRAFAIFNFNA